MRAFGAFECPTCHEHFSTHRELALHAFSHPKLPVVPEPRLCVDCGCDITGRAHNTQRCAECAAKDHSRKVGEAKARRAKESAMGASGNYECSVCHRTFGTGNALGGHMKVHNAAENGVRPEVSKDPPADASLVVEEQAQVAESVEVSAPNPHLPGWDDVRGILKEDTVLMAGMLVSPETKILSGAVEMMPMPGDAWALADYNQWLAMFDSVCRVVYRLPR